MPRRQDPDRRQLAWYLNPRTASQSLRKVEPKGVEYEPDHDSD